MIIENTIRALLTDYKHQFRGITLERLVLGRNFTAVLLSNGSCGMAGAETNDKTHNKHHNRILGHFAPGNISGSNVEDILTYNKDNRIPFSVKLAIINALSSSILNDEDFIIHENCDPYDLLHVCAEDTLTIVGAFRNYIKKAIATGCRLHVLELNKEAMPPEHEDVFVSEQEAEIVLQQSNKIIITGSSLVNNTLPSLLSKIQKNALTAITGPTANLLPQVLFDSGIQIIGGTRITDSATMFRIISEGGSGYHLFEHCAIKICILKNKLSLKSE
jgi:uncharacterized protein